MRFCKNSPCSTHPSFGWKGSGRAEYCRKHKEVGMVNVNCKMCSFRGCRERALYASKDSPKPVFCGQHKEVGMVKVVNMLCAYDGCYKQPSFGADGSKELKFCYEHGRSSMVIVHSTQCAHGESSWRPSYREERSKDVTMCIIHKTTGADHLSTKTCATKGCAEYATHGLDGSRRQKLFCWPHFREVNRAIEEAVHSPNSDEVGEGIGKGAGEQISLTSSAKRAVKVELSPGQVQQISGTLDCDSSREKRMRLIGGEKPGPSQQGHKDSAPVRESSASPSPARLTPSASLNSSDQPQDTYLVEANREPSLVRSDQPRGERHSTASTKTRSEEYPRRGIGGKRVEAKSRGTFVTSCSAGSERRNFSTSSQDRRRVRATCAFVRENGAKGASSEVEKDQAAVQDVADMVEQFNRQISDAAADGARSAAQASGKVEQKRKMDNQGLRNELGAASKLLRANATSYAAGCEERQGLQQQLTDVQAQVASAACKIKTGSAKAEKDTENVQQRVKALLVDLTAASTGWESTKEDAEEIRRERDALHEKLEKQVADAAVDRARVVTEATGKVEDKYTKDMEALRHELGVASKLLADNASDYRAVCKERRGLRQQLTSVQAQVPSATGKIKTDSAKAEMDKESFQQQMKALRVELTAASTGWEGTEIEVKEIRQERDALRKQVEELVASRAEIASKAAAHSKALRDRMKSVKEGRDTAVQATEIVGTPGPGLVIPASLLQSLLAGLETIASPAALVTAASAAQSSGGATAADLPTPAAEAASSNSFDGAMEESGVHDG